MTINLSLLPAPEVVEPLDFETILATIKADFLALAPDMAGVLALESEPATKLCEVFAYRELLLRARINDAAKSVMLAYARGADLEHLAALLGVVRLADETDPRLRMRAQLSLEGFSTAGPRLSYVYHVLSASNDVLDTFVDSPTPGHVRIVVLAVPSGDNPDGVPGQALLDTVHAAVNADDVRPLTDMPTVMAAEVIPYQVAASLVFQPGAGQSAVLQAAQQALADYVEDHFRLGYDITVSGLKAALRRPGVTRVNLALPAPATGVEQDVLISVSNVQAARCTMMSVTAGGVGI